MLTDSNVMTGSKRFDNHVRCRLAAPYILAMARYTEFDVIALNAPLIIQTIKARMAESVSIDCWA